MLRCSKKFIDKYAIQIKTPSLSVSLKTIQTIFIGLVFEFKIITK
jgi:hypothetical protein